MIYYNIEHRLNGGLDNKVDKSNVFEITLYITTVRLKRVKKTRSIEAYCLH